MFRRLLYTVLASWRYFVMRNFRGDLASHRESDRRLLLLVTSFPPDISGGVYRPASLVRYAPDHGWQPTVVTCPAPVPASGGGAALLDYVGQAAPVLRIPECAVQPIQRLFPQVDGGMLAAMEMVDRARQAFGVDLPGVIVASGPSFSTYVAAYMLTRKTDRKLVLEYRDEWTLCPFPFVSKSASDLEWERRCLDRADLVILTTESQKQHLERSFPGLVDGKCEVIANGWEPALQPRDRQTTHDQEPAGEEFWLTFAGMLGDHADPSVFLESLAAVFARRPDLAARIRVRFVGKKRPLMRSRIREFPFPGVVDDVDHVPSTEAVRMMRESIAVLLFHSAHFERYIPGKLYEYAASGASILLFDDCGESHRIVQDQGFGRSIASGDEIGLELALDELISEQRQKQMNGRPALGAEQRRWLGVHTRESLAADFFRLIEHRFE